MSKQISLNDLIIGYKCNNNWEEMTGNSNNYRLCKDCNLYVYNFADYTELEIIKLIENNNGKLCARIERSKEGSIITNPNSKNRFNSRITSRAAGLVLTVVLSIFNSSQNIAQGKVQNQISEENQNQLIKKCAVEGNIADQTDAIIIGADITFTRLKTNEQFKTTTNEKGEYSIALEPGAYKVRVEVSGFQPYEIKFLKIPYENNITLQVALNSVDSVEVEVGILVCPNQTDSGGNANSAIPQNNTNDKRFEPQRRIKRE